MENPRAATPPVTTYLVEGYWPDREIATFAAAALRLDECVAGLQREGFSITATTAALVPGDDATLWIVDSSSADVVELAFSRAGMRVERIVPAFEVQRPRAMRAEPSLDAAPSRIGHPRSGGRNDSDDA